MFILQNLNKIINKPIYEICYKRNLNFNDAPTVSYVRRWFSSTCNRKSQNNSTASSASGIPADTELGTKIYYGTLTQKMKAVKIFSITTSVTGLAVQPLLIEQGAKIGGTPMVIFLCTFAGFFTFATPIFLHLITKKYVTEIYYNEANDQYTAATISLFLQRNLTKFQAKDVIIPDVPGMFTTIKIGKTPLFIDISQFSDPKHYAKIMGYDKPMDFKLNLSEIKPEKEHKS